MLIWFFYWPILKSIDLRCETWLTHRFRQSFIHSMASTHLNRRRMNLTRVEWQITRSTFCLISISMRLYTIVFFDLLEFPWVHSDHQKFVGLMLVMQGYLSDWPLKKEPFLIMGKAPGFFVAIFWQLFGVAGGFGGRTAGHHRWL